MQSLIINHIAKFTYFFFYGPNILPNSAVFIVGRGVRFESPFSTALIIV